MRFVFLRLMGTAAFEAQDRVSDWFYPDSPMFRKAEYTLFRIFVLLHFEVSLASQSCTLEITIRR